MTRDSGSVAIFKKHDPAENGAMPAPVWDVLRCEHYFGVRTVGVTRYWTARGNNDQVDLLIQIDRDASISTRDRALLHPFTRETVGGWYKILQVQHVVDDDGLLATDLSLERIEDLNPEEATDDEY